MKYIAILSTLVAIVLAYLLATRPTVTEYVEDVTREMELLDTLDLLTAHNRALATQKDSIQNYHLREKVVYTRTTEAQRAEIRSLRAQIPDRITIDTSFLNYEAAMKLQRVTDSAHIARQSVTIDSLHSISTAILKNVVVSDRIHSELLSRKDQEIAQLTKSVKTEKRKRVLSQIFGALAVGAVIVLSN